MDRTNGDETHIMAHKDSWKMEPYLILQPGMK